MQLVIFIIEETRFPTNKYISPPSPEVYKEVDINAEFFIN